MEAESARLLEITLKGKELGHKIFFLGKIDSTQNYAHFLLQNCSESLHGVVIIAREQSDGHGRMGRKWISQPGGLWMSVILERCLTLKTIPMIQFISSLAVADSISNLTGLECKTKWPNDLLLGGKKICGVIVDVSFEGNKANHAIIGIGLNANFEASSMGEVENQTFISRVTTLRDELGIDIDLNNLTKLIIERLEYYYSQLKEDKIKSIVDIWKNRSDFFGRLVSVDDGREIFHGIPTGVDENGILEINLSDGSVRRVIFGDMGLLIT
jgi:BirA family transcriptional regulator, biotin operon repressor / biotin---[acetyl-CoA-carboxylase] ligase